MPLTVFSHSTDSKGVIELLREGGVEVSGNEDKWDGTLEIKEGLFKKKKRIVLHYDKEYCSPPNWPTQINGMENFFGDFPIPDQKRETIMSLIRSFRFTIGITLEPELTDGEDTRLYLARAVANHLDGVFFLSSGCLVDPDFGTLIDPEGESDPEAQFPHIPEEEVDHGEPAVDEEIEYHPPAASRVVARMHALTAVAARGLLDMNLAQGNSPAYSHQDLLDWVEQTGIPGELEPNEITILQTPPGELDQEATINSAWRLEGLAVLAWALGLADLPRYDQLVETDRLLEVLGFGSGIATALAIKDNPKLKSPNALENYNKQIFALHWRMVEYRVRPQAVDFAKMKEECWFGPLDLSWAEFSGDDLALQGKAITKSDPELLSIVSSLAAERHIASNWLIGQEEVYSLVDAST